MGIETYCKSHSKSIILSLNQVLINYAQNGMAVTKNDFFEGRPGPHRSHGLGHLHRVVNGKEGLSQSIFILKKLQLINISQRNFEISKIWSLQYQCRLTNRIGFRYQFAVFLHFIIVQLKFNIDKKMWRKNNCYLLQSTLGNLLVSYINISCHERMKRLDRF